MPLRMYTLYLGEDQLAALKEHSQQQQVPVSRYIRQAVDIFLGSGQPCLITSGQVSPLVYFSSGMAW